MNRFIPFLRRETSSGAYLPAIDGLRFLAIILVLLFHMHGYLIGKNAVFLKNSNSFWLNIPVFKNGFQGVQLFFVISGFILALPFAQYYVGQAPSKVSLKKYFLRRILRLEPPYIVSLFLFYVAAIIVAKTYSVSELTPSLGSSLVYMHWFFYPDISPKINCVIWSLEIEIQYYILAPFIMQLFYKINSFKIRCIAISILIIASPYFAIGLNLHYNTILNYVQYFLAGILLCDSYLYFNSEKVDSNIAYGLGICLLTGIVCLQFVQTVAMTNYHDVTYLYISHPFVIVLFYFLVLKHAFWNRIFSINFLTIIGGMCYSLYLLHYPVISFIGRLSLDKWKDFGANIYIPLQMMLFLFVILIISTIYFLLIEKPCMKKDWHKNLFKKYDR